MSTVTRPRGEAHYRSHLGLDERLLPELFNHGYVIEGGGRRTHTQQNSGNESLKHGVKFS